MLKKVSFAPMTRASVAIMSLMGPVSIIPGSTGTASAQSAVVEEIIVTARRREEQLKDVPISISALTASTLADRGIKELKDIATLAPNFTYNTYQTQAAGRRTNQQLTLRGVARGGVGVFLNGAPTNSLVADIGDLERIEVLRGPQSAYFGRATFAGAVNFVTKAPSNEWKGKIDALRGSENWSDIRGSFEGPIVADILTFRLSGRGYSSDGQYTNAPDGMNLTKQQTNSVSVVVDYHPTDDLTVNIVGLYSYLHDGPPAYAKFRRDDFNCSPGAAAGQINYLCGRLPRYPLNRVGADWPSSPQFRAILFDNVLNFPNNIDNDEFEDTKPGALSRNFQVITRIDYTYRSNNLLDGVIVSYLNSLTGSMSEGSNNALGEPLGAIPNPNILTEPTRPYISPGAANGPNANLAYFQGSAYPNFGTTPWIDNGFKYHELRIASDPAQRFDWMAGAQYSLDYTPFTRRTGISPTGAINLSNTNTTVTKSGGFFGSLTYAILDDLTATIEGRYQLDHITLRNRRPGAVGTTVYSAKDAPIIQTSNTKQFNPRASLTYAVSPDITTYASFARGINPSAFNTALFTVPQSTRDIVKAQTGADVQLKGERLDTYEVGVKGSLADGRLSFDVDSYYGKWTNQVIQVVVVIPSPNNPAILTFLRPNANVGGTDLHGLELNVSGILTDNITANGTFGLQKSKIKDYFCTVCETSVTGSGNVIGNKTPRVPEKTGTLFVEYKDTLIGDTKWFTNGQLVYVDGSYVDETNLSWTMSRSTFDFRVGLEFSNWMFEAFVLNAFNDYYYTDASRDGDFASRRTPAFNNAIVVGLPEMRRWGLRGRVDF